MGVGVGVGRGAGVMRRLCEVMGVWVGGVVGFCEGGRVGGSDVWGVKGVG